MGGHRSREGAKEAEWASSIAGWPANVTVGVEPSPPHLASSKAAALRPTPGASLGGKPDVETGGAAVGSGVGSASGRG